MNTEIMEERFPEVNLLHHAPLHVAVYAIRKCWASEGKSDSYFDAEGERLPIEVCTLACSEQLPWRFVLGKADAGLLRNVIKKGHESTVEHLAYGFEIKGISRGLLQELARHRIASLSVQSSRYTLKRLLEGGKEALIPSGDSDIDALNRAHMRSLKEIIERKGLTNDVAKYGLVEAWATELVWTVNARSLRNFLRLRTSRAAHFEIRRLAYKVFHNLPFDHQPLFADALVPSKEKSPC